jgi:hypothetical protein
MDAVCWSWGELPLLAERLVAVSEVCPWAGKAKNKNRNRNRNSEAKNNVIERSFIFPPLPLARELKVVQIGIRRRQNTFPD